MCINDEGSSTVMEASVSSRQGEFSTGSTVKIVL